MRNIPFIQYATLCEHMVMNIKLHNYDSIFLSIFSASLNSTVQILLLSIFLQNPMDEFDFTVTNLATDLQDGLRLV